MIVLNENSKELLMCDVINMRTAQVAAERIGKDSTIKTILDVGSGGGDHSKYFTKLGKKVTAVDFGKSKYYTPYTENGITFCKGDYNEMALDQKYDAVWCAHVLEHQQNAGLFIKKLFNDCSDDGLVCITVPPLKHQIVGGHVSLWNAGLLLYNVVLSGHDCSQASILKYGYNISLIVRKNPFDINTIDLTHDSGDINRLKRYFPSNLSEPFDGNIENLNWK